MEKSGPGQEGHPTSRVNFTERSYERKSWLCNDNTDRTSSDRLSATELTRLGEPKCLYGEKLTQLGGRPCHRKRVTRLGGSPFKPSQHFGSRVNGLPFCKEVFEKLARSG